MSKIHSQDTKPEAIVRKYLFKHGLRYRKNDKRYPGKPDIVLPKFHTVLFVHGCFWHCHEGCSDFVIPKSNTDYWLPKLQRNRQRDEANINTLKSAGWRVLVIWECELKKPVREERLRLLFETIISTQNNLSRDSRPKKIRVAEI
jgi:DNA mismatch endonuclease (patch repair protein)